MTRVRAYLAMSLDGYAAGPQDDLAWLEPRGADAAPIATGAWAQEPAAALEFDQFLAQVGVILMGRRTYDIVDAMGEWLYGEVRMQVATHRPIEGTRPTVEAVEGDLGDLIAGARARAGEGDVYIDGAALVRGALQRGLLDHLVITLVPTVLGGGVSLFDGIEESALLTVEKVARYGEGLVQLHLTPEGR